MCVCVCGRCKFNKSEQRYSSHPSQRHFIPETPGSGLGRYWTTILVSIVPIRVMYLYVHVDGLQKLGEYQHGCIPRKKRKEISRFSHCLRWDRGPLSRIQRALEEIMVFFHHRDLCLPARWVFGRVRVNKRPYHLTVRHILPKCNGCMGTSPMWRDKFSVTHPGD